MSTNDGVLALVGPTASGKTALSLLLAEALDAEIVSADSRQIYRWLDVGTAKPSPEELRRIAHHFIDLLDPKDEYNAGEYGRQARLRIEDVIRRKKVPLLVGGSGLYIRSVIDGIFEGPGKDDELRARLAEEERTCGPGTLYRKLQSVDPNSAATMDATKLHRIIRALEVWHTTGTPISELHRQQNLSLPFPVLQFGLEWERPELYARINRRVEAMVERGLIEEVRGLITKGYARDMNALNTVGYKETFDFIDGRLTHDEMLHLIKRNTRHFAKRQMTWFKADKRIQWIHVDEKKGWEEIRDRIVEDFRNQKISSSSN